MGRTRAALVALAASVALLATACPNDSGGGGGGDGGLYMGRPGSGPSYSTVSHPMSR
jgi:hypothetical protein